MSRRRRHTAFTTIELLVAISILVILAGMVFVGFKTVGGGGKTRATRAALETARAMLGEVDATGGLAPIKEIYQGVTASPRYAAAFSPVPTGTAPTPIPAPSGNVSSDAYSSSNTARFAADAIVKTQQVMGRVLSAPANRTVLTQLPSERLMKWPGGTAIAGGVTIDLKNQLSPQMLADAWGNPIIYVPPAGLSGVKAGDQVNQVITSVKTRAAYGPTDSIAPGAAAFWASAGADGDFTTGDDNVYSFE